MKLVLKTLLIGLFVVIVIGSLFCVYILNAPSVAQTEPPKLQVHKRTAVRGRPTVNSKPIVYTKNQYLFSIDQRYISNLNIGVYSREMLFSIALGHRANLTPDALDKELKTAFNWKEMFDDSLGGIQISSGSSQIKVLLSGQDWILTDSTGAGYTVARNNNVLDIYLPNFEEAFNTQKINLSNDLKFSVVEKNKHWLMNDNKLQQNYEIRNGKNQLNVYQQSKYPILTKLFHVDTTSAETLSQGKLSTELREGFKRKNIELPINTKLIADEDGVSWQIIDGTQKYNVQMTDSWIDVYLDLNSKWVYIGITDAIKGWIPLKSGTLFMPSAPILSSRQQLKERLIAFIDGFKRNEKDANNPKQLENSELTK
ncbi:MAG: hypothetical protein OXD54_10445 [Candidatus Poribacteria bacterium]|nr:hypothetical protein [Candidatus Poribacteria bacterium]